MADTSSNAVLDNGEVSVGCPDDPENIGLEDLVSGVYITMKRDIEVDQRVMPLVIPYLSLTDLSSLRILDPRWQEIVDKYISDGNNISIHGELLELFPVDANRDLYNQFKQATSLTLIEVADTSIAEVFVCFDNIKKLRMIKMAIIESMEVLPRSLTELAVTQCQVETIFLDNWIVEMGNTLTSIYMDTNNTFSTYKIGELALLDSLVIKVPKVEGYFNCVKLRSLKIITNNICLKLYFGHQLESLYLDCPYNDNTIDDICESHFLRSLTLRTWSADLYSAALKTLTHLKVLHSVDVKYQEQLEKLNIKTLQVHYLKPPLQPNLIFILNNDCLLKILEYIKSIDDRVSIAQVHPRLDELIVAHTFSDVKVDWRNAIEIAEEMEAHKGFTIRIAPYINKLIWNGISDIEMPPILSHLINLSVLILEYVEIQCLPSQMPAKLEHLSLINCYFEYLDSYLQILSPTLRKLQLIDTYDIPTSFCLSNIINIQELDVNKFDEVDFDKLLLRNQKSVKSLALYVDRMPTSSWRLIGDIEQLNTVKLLCTRRYGDYLVQDNIVHNINHLLISIGSKLTKLTVELCDFSLRGVLKNKFLNGLSELTIKYYSWTSLRADLHTLCTFKALVKLQITIYEPFEDNSTASSDLLILVKSLPELMIMRINEPRPLPESFRVHVWNYLRNAERKLLINSQHFP